MGGWVMSRPLAGWMLPLAGCGQPGGCLPHCLHVESTRPVPLLTAGPLWPPRVHPIPCCAPLQGATVVDFAYHIHTEMGNTMVAAKVNGKLVGADHELANAEVVEVVRFR